MIAAQTATAASPPAAIDPDRLYTLREVCNFIPSHRTGGRINVVTLWRWVKKRRLESVRLGAGRFIYGREITRFLEACRVPARGSAPRYPNPTRPLVQKAETAEILRRFGIKE